jgi:hypothetical protein
VDDEEEEEKFGFGILYSCLHMTPEVELHKKLSHTDKTITHKESLVAHTSPYFHTPYSPANSMSTCSIDGSKSPHSTSKFLATGVRH